MSLKILILGNINSIFILNYVKALKTKINCQIDIFTIPIELQQKKYVSQFIKYFSNIYEISEYNKKIIKHIPKIRGLFQIKSIANQINDLRDYDICHIHYLLDFYGPVASQIVKKSKKLVISIYGSDFYRAKGWVKRFQYPIIKCADRITFVNQQTLEEFGNYFKEIDKNKLKVKEFGSTPLDTLKKNKNISKEECKDFFNIPTNNVVVTCGYNASPFHQHIKMIKSINMVKHKLPANLLFLFPFTYIFNNTYFLEVKNLLDKSNLNYKIFTDFLSDEEVAKLRKASDVMINAQTTDQLSDSMLESLYAGNIVISGDWLPYNILEDKGIFMLKISSVEEIGEKLIYVMDNIERLRESFSGNGKIIGKILSWDNKIDEWIEMYLEILKE